MADLDLQSLGMRLGEAITPTPRDAPQVRYGTIDAVNADGTLDVAIDGTTLRGMCATTGCVGAQAGMRCVVLRQGPLATVVGLVANHGLQNVWLPNSGTIIGHDTDGNAREVLQATNANNNVVVGWGGYDASQGATSVYGNVVNLVARDGVKNGSAYLPDGNVTGILVTNNSDVTTTSTTTIGTLTHTSKTGHVLIVANMILATSRNTSSMQVYGQNTQFIHRRTNITSPTRIDGMAHAYPSRGAAITYTLRMTSQDTSTTATFKSYNTAELFVLDI